MILVSWLNELLELSQEERIDTTASVTHAHLAQLTTCAHGCDQLRQATEPRQTGDRRTVRSIAPERAHI